MAGAALLPILALAQTSPVPPAPPSPPAGAVQPGGPGPHDRAPKVPVTWLGVETSGVPRVVSEQLGLPKGFGLVVDYVVPDGPAAAAGVQQSDILKMLNDQILTEPDQLSKLIRSFQEGTTVTLTVLRKGAEQKLQVKLGKHEVSGRHFGEMRFDGMPGPGDVGENQWNFDFSGMNRELERMKDKLGDSNIRDTVRNAHREAMRAAREARQQARELRVLSKNAGALRSTRIDLGKAQVVYSDDHGEIKIENVDGKKVLTAKDPQGKLVFSGPVETKEDIDKLPPEVRQRYDKLEHKDLPAVGQPTFNFTTRDGDDDNDTSVNENDDDADDADQDAAPASMQQVSFPGFPRRVWTLDSVLI